MNSKQVKNYLLEIQRLDALIRCKTAEIVRNRELVLSITPQLSSDPVTTSKNTDRIGGVVAKIVDMQNEIEIAVDRLFDVKEERVAVINKVQDPLQLELLHKRYVQYKSLKEIAVEMKISYDSARSIHGQALRVVANILEPRYNHKKSQIHTKSHNISHSKGDIV